MALPELLLTNFTYYYPDAERPALDQINWSVRQGEFVVLAGKSGCGKSTLLRALNGLVPEFYGGRVGGVVQYRGRSLAEYDNRRIASHVGMVFQDPERQLVMTEVERELAFGLENAHVSTSEMRRRVAEVLNFFDLAPLRHKRTADLSGGEKQKVAIAAVMALQPDVLLLDEPTSQLDPGAAQEILDLIKRLNEELGLTVVLVEQRLDRVVHLADRIVALDGGRIEYDGSPQGFAHFAAEQRPELLVPVTKLFVQAGRSERPLTVKAARQLVREQIEASGCAVADLAPRQEEAPRRAMSSKLAQVMKKMFGAGPLDPQDVLLEARDVRFGYPHGVEVLKGLRVQIGRGQFTSLLGANGAGKSTLFRQFAALAKPQEGKVLFAGRDTKSLEPADLAGKLGYLSQNPGDYLFHDTLRAECEFSRTLVGLSVGDAEAERVLANVLDSLGLLSLLDRNPRDLSGGERQRAALATVLVQQPQALLLDEPTRGLDAGQKESLGEWLTAYVRAGGSVVLITHDIEFAAEYAERILLLDDGQVVAEGSPQDMLTRGLFYSPQTSRVFHGVLDRVVTLADGAEALRRMDAQGGEHR
ncbi:ABC transporter ATP-binding protein [Tumebacillus permanentifrigoris]|uniref:Energy-coupling factor transport system ATP-binding protein n=1 Tax=Tumebacillus permanentifrigoris TaxID=378543 RepID=A0A316D9B7_9BACL|nr:ABC transporter ATP-binding protein [Tumebacillus permanentifrigoris]PWK13781.1 energy-coupling factor transport system ATP-binding protein [Tumebacillus permanentifrigoris]